MEKTNTRKIIIKVIVFLIIGCILFQMLTAILMPEWVYPNDVTLTLRGFYNEPKNSLDVITVGNSNIYRGVSPMALWNEYGITTYAYSSPIQKIWMSYYIIKECFEYQKPKIIMLDMDAAFDEDKATEMSVRKLFDNFKLSKNKIEAINDPIFELSNFDKLTYIFPLIRYHSRWDSLKESDFRRLGVKYDSTFKGYLLSKSVKPYDKKNKYMEPKDKNKSEKIGEKVGEYLEKIIKLCKENNTELVLMELPAAKSWSSNKNEEVTNFAKKHNLKFLDMNLDENMPIDWEKDTEDNGFHLNVYGAEKVSKYLGKYLKDNYNMINNRNNKNYSNWNNAFEKYEEEKNKK